MRPSLSGWIGVADASSARARAAKERAVGACFLYVTEWLPAFPFARNLDPKVEGIYAPGVICPRNVRDKFELEIRRAVEDGADEGEVRRALGHFRIANHTLEELEAATNDRDFAALVHGGFR